MGEADKSARAKAADARSDDDLVSEPGMMFVFSDEEELDSPLDKETRDERATRPWQSRRRDAN